MQINAPATLDLVKLDHFDTTEIPPYSPPFQERAPSMGIDLRRRTVLRGDSKSLLQAAAASTLAFEGA